MQLTNERTRNTAEGEVFLETDTNFREEENEGKDNIIEGKVNANKERELYGKVRKKRKLTGETLYCEYNPSLTP